MPATKRVKTRYPGVYYIKSFIPGTTKPDRIYYIIYRRQGKLIEEKAGRQSSEDMSPARASAKRTARIEGIPLNNPTRQVFKDMPRTSIYVFPGKKGKQRNCIKYGVNKIKTEAGLPKDFRPLHGLRHVYASMLASSGQVDLYTLQKLMTHKNPQMTQRYAHLRDDALRKASDLAGDIIAETIKKKRLWKSNNQSFRLARVAPESPLPWQLADLILIQGARMARSPRA